MCQWDDILIFEGKKLFFLHHLPNHIRISFFNPCQQINHHACIGCIEYFASYAIDEGI